MNDERSLIAGINALRMGYAQKAISNPDQVICPPWTRRDVSDMLMIRDGLSWLLAEIKAGFMLTEERHGWIIRNIDAVNAALERKERAFRAKAGFNPNQPRVPAGSSDGGQWTDAGGGSGGQTPSSNESEGYGRYRIPKPADEPYVRPASYGSTAKVPKPPKQMSVSKDGIDAIKEHEGFKPKVYLDTAGKPTIGYGHLLKPGESFPNGVSKAEAEKLLRDDLHAAQEAVRKNVKVDLTQPQFDALTSFTYNFGEGKFKDSTLLKRVNEGRFEDAANEFHKWNKERVNGVLRPNQGLTNRRQREEDLFRSGIPDKKPSGGSGRSL